MFLTVADATGKIPAGILEGNIQNLGSMDECLAAKADEYSLTFTGKYCLVKFQIPVWRSKSKSNNYTAVHPFCRDISTLLNVLMSKINTVYCLYQQCYMVRSFSLTIIRHCQCTEYNYSKQKKRIFSETWIKFRKRRQKLLKMSTDQDECSIWEM